MCQIFEILRNIFSVTKLRQLNGQRQLLENKQMLRNDSDIRDFVTCQIAFLMRYFKHKFHLISMSKIHIINKQIRSTVFDSGGNKNV